MGMGLVSQEVIKNCLQCFDHYFVVKRYRRGGQTGRPCGAQSTDTVPMRAACS